MAEVELERNCRRYENIISRYNYYFKKQLGFPDNGTKYDRVPVRGHYPFIPSIGLTDLMNTIHSVGNHILSKSKSKMLKFLDCGCGIGNIVLIALSIGNISKAHGIEYDKDTFMIAEKLVRGAGNIFHNDILKFSNYKNYDIIYFYTPMSDERKQTKFAHKLVTNMKVGAVVIANGSSHIFDCDDRFVRLKIEYRYRTFEKVRKRARKGKTVKA